MPNTVTYSRTIQVEQYNPERLEVTLEFDDLTQAQAYIDRAIAEVNEGLASKGEAAKRSQLPAAVPAQPTAVATSSTSFTPSDDADDFVQSLKTASKEEREIALAERLESHPNEFWDNRDKIASGEYSAKAPAYKHKGSGQGLWV